LSREDVLNIARLVLAHCDGAIHRDERGYDIFDAVTVREILNPDIFGVGELMDEEVEYLRLKLLRYKKQIQKIAVEHGVPQEKITEALKKLDEPLAESSVIIHGKLKGNSQYGRISLKWLMMSFHEPLVLDKVNFAWGQKVG